MEDRPLSTSDLAGASSEEPEAAKAEEPRAPDAGVTPIRGPADAGQGAASDREGVVVPMRGGGEGGPTTQAPATGQTAETTGESGTEPLLPSDQAERFRSDWSGIQAGFVDEPRQSVQQADALVADLMQRLASEFAGERQNLESQWDRGDDVSTEDLRVALQRYRSFFDRLLAA